MTTAPDHEDHLTALRTANVYRPYLLHATVTARADEHGTYCPPTKVGLRRDLTRPRDLEDYQVLPAAEVANTVRQGIAMGLLDQSSTPERLTLAGMGGAE